mmetsp:Transcript_8321/g.22123  ORF Transcript_8321/g.22123 Transcript_8321/m.22123 type:complete len:582 (-) Transcript_8321:3373-5118(-)
METAGCSQKQEGDVKEAVSSFLPSSDAFSSSDTDFSGGSDFDAAFSETESEGAGLLSSDGYSKEGVSARKIAGQHRDSKRTKKGVSLFRRRHCRTLGPTLKLLLALIPQTLWGVYPVVGRYLQTTANLPSLSLSFCANFCVFLLMLPYVLKRVGLKKIWRQKSFILLFAPVIATRAITNLLAPRFTLAVYVQLITLATPFLVAVLSRIVLREKLPRFFLPSLLVSFAGSLLVLLGGMGSAEGEGERVGREGEASIATNESTEGLTVSDAVGFALAFVASCCLATYMILVKKAESSRKLSGEAVVFVQTFFISIIALPLSFVFSEDWEQWSQLSIEGWGYLLFFTLGVVLLGNLGAVWSIRYLGPTMVSSLLPWRLVVALVSGYLILGEDLHTPWQYAGAGLVALNLTAFLVVSRRRQAVKKEEEGRIELINTIRREAAREEMDGHSSAVVVEVRHEEEGAREGEDGRQGEEAESADGSSSNGNRRLRRWVKRGSNADGEGEEEEVEEDDEERDEGRRGSRRYEVEATEEARGRSMFVQADRKGITSTQPPSSPRRRRGEGRRKKIKKSLKRILSWANLASD